MSDPPRIEITAGSPTPAEEAVVRTAVLRLWREADARAAAAESPSRWVVAARAAATRNGIADLRGQAGPGSSWRLSQRVAGFGLMCARRLGRGDSK